MITGEVGEAEISTALPRARDFTDDRSARTPLKASSKEPPPVRSINADIAIGVPLTLAEKS